MDPMDILKGVVGMASSTEKQEAYLRRMEAAHERREKADVACLDGMKRLEGVLEEIENGIHQELSVEDAAILADRAAKVGQAMANLRMSISNAGYYGFGYGMLRRRACQQGERG